jgi:hypothetical protein
MRPRRIPFPEIVLAVLMLLVGHDVLMAADPHGVAASHEAHSAGYKISGDNEATCHLPEGTRPDPPDRPEPAVVPISAIGVSTQHRVDTGRASWADPPGSPPDVRRALLQVFLN